MMKGLYLVVDASMDKEELLKKVEKGLKGGVKILQLWSNWKNREEALELGKRLLELARKYGALLIINNDYKLAIEIGADGVHFDSYEILPQQVKNEKKDMIVGYTIGNDLERAIWAEKVNADYISFCACFPSSSVTECEIVPLSTVEKAKKMLKIPVFASGGITLKNVDRVLEKGVDGVAVISAILKAEDPEATARAFSEKIEKYQQRSLGYNPI